MFWYYTTFTQQLLVCLKAEYLFENMKVSLAKKKSWIQIHLGTFKVPKKKQISPERMKSLCERKMEW